MQAPLISYDRKFQHKLTDGGVYLYGIIDSNHRRRDQGYHLRSGGGGGPV